MNQHRTDSPEPPSIIRFRFEHREMQNAVSNIQASILHQDRLEASSCKAVTHGTGGAIFSAEMRQPRSDYQLAGRASRFRAHKHLILAGFLLLFLSISALAQEPFPPLQTAELANVKLIENIYLGRFDRIPRFDSDGTITDDGLLARQLFMGYVVAFSDHCQESLGPNKKEIKETITTYTERQQLWLTRYGVMMGPTYRENIKSETRSTGVWAHEDYADTYMSIANSTGSDTIALLLREIISKRSNNLGGAALNFFTNLLKISMESRVLIARHGCNSTQVVRYSANLLNYVRGQSPAYQDETFIRNCRNEIAKIIPGSRPQSCTCLQRVFSQRLKKRQLWELEDNFSQQNLLTMAVSKVDLSKEVASCLK